MAKGIGDGKGKGEHEHGKANIRKTTAAQQAREVVGRSVERTQEKRNGIGAPVAWPLDEARRRVLYAERSRYMTGTLCADVSK